MAKRTKTNFAQSLLIGKCGCLIDYETEFATGIEMDTPGTINIMKMCDLISVYRAVVTVAPQQFHISDHPRPSAAWRAAEIISARVLAE